MAISRNQNPKQLKGKKPIPKGNKGLAKLKKVNPQVVAQMGFKKKGGLVKRSQGSSTEGEISPRMKKRIDKKIKEEKLKDKKSNLGKQGTQRTPGTGITPRLPRRTPRRGMTGKPKGRVYKI